MIYKDVGIQLTVVKLEQISYDYKTVVFKRPANFNFEAGDWIDIDFAGQPLKGGKTYSLSSSPTEPELAITFREGISPFKQRLQAVQPGDKMLISQYGNSYDFQLNELRSSVLIAGGIGIAPFRSMLKEIHDSGVNAWVRLIYLNKTDDFLFRDELEVWQRSITRFSVQYIVTKDLKRKAREQQLGALLAAKSDRYYIAGPEAMVENTEHQLLDMSVDIKDIRIDSFGEY